jgi:hypothetical protein
MNESTAALAEAFSRRALKKYNKKFALYKPVSLVLTISRCVCCRMIARDLRSSISKILNIKVVACKKNSSDYSVFRNSLLKVATMATKTLAEAPNSLRSFFSNRPIAIIYDLAVKSCKTALRAKFDHTQNKNPVYQVCPVFISMTFFVMVCLVLSSL